MRLDLSFLKHTNVYLVSSVIQNAIPFLVLPIITVYIAPAEYSYIAMFSIMISVFGAFIGLNAHGAIGRKFIEKDDMDFSAYIGNAIIVYFLSLLVVILLTLLLMSDIEKYTSLTTYWIFVAYVASSFQFFINIYLTLLQMQSKSLSYGIFNIIKSISNTLLILLFVIYLHQDWEGYLKATVIIYFLFAVISLLFLFKAKNFKIVFKYDYFMNIVKFGTPLIPHVLGGIAIAMTDRLLLVNLVGNEATGIYQLSWQMALPMSLLIEAFKNSYIPWLYNKLKTTTNDQKIVIITYSIIMAILIIATIFVFIINLIVLHFFDARYVNSTDIIPYLIYAFAFNGVYYMVGLIISYVEKTSLLAILTFISGILNFIFSYYLILENGMIGAAQGTLLAYLITLLLTWVLSSHVRPMPWFSFWRKNNELH